MTLQCPTHLLNSQTMLTVSKSRHPGHEVGLVVPPQRDDGQQVHDGVEYEQDEDWLEEEVDGAVDRQETLVFANFR